MTESIRTMTPPPGKVVILKGAAGVMLNRAALALGLRRRRDGWRRAAALVLGGECSCFVLSAFGLRAWSDGVMPAGCRPEVTRAHAVRRLLAFVAREPLLHRVIVPGEILHEVRGSATPGVTIRCDTMPDGPARFAAPSDWIGEPLSWMEGAVPLVRLVLRFDAEGHVDVWARINHVGSDGVPMQEVISRLETEWGGSEGVRYPTPREFAAVAGPIDLADRAGFAEGQAFVDFSALWAWRAGVAGRVPGGLTLGAALVWQLGWHPEFRGTHFGSTVEIPESVGLARGVGVVVVEPTRFERTERGLAGFAAAFNKGIETTRRRASSACRTLDAAAYIGAGSAKALLEHALEHDPGAFGDAAVTMLRNARVFGVPIGRRGHARGFLAVGGVNLPATDGTRVGCVTFKGPRALVERLPRVLQEATRCAGGPGV